MWIFDYLTKCMSTLRYGSKFNPSTILYLWWKCEVQIDKYYLIKIYGIKYNLFTIRFNIRVTLSMYTPTSLNDRTVLFFCFKYNTISINNVCTFITRWLLDIFE